jgi:hypothetical protein
MHDSGNVERRARRLVAPLDRGANGRLPAAYAGRHGPLPRGDACGGDAAHRCGTSDAGISAIVRESVLTCPHCGCAKAETMPVDACLWFYECTRCKTMLRPRVGDCCVFCSYGSIRCPPAQEGDGCCPGA